MTLIGNRGRISTMRVATRHILFRFALSSGCAVAGLLVGREWKQDTIGLVVGAGIGDAAASIIIDHCINPDGAPHTAAPNLQPINSAASNAARTNEFSTPVRELGVQVTQ